MGTEEIAMSSGQVWDRSGTPNGQFDIMTLRLEFFPPSLCSSHQQLLSASMCQALFLLLRDSGGASAITGKDEQTNR